MTLKAILGKLARSNGKKITRRSVFAVLFISYMVFMAVAVLGNYIYFVESDRHSREASQKARQTMLDQYGNIFDTRMEEVQRLSNRIVFDSQLDYIVRSIPIQSLSQFQNNLLTMDPNNPYILDYFVYLADQDMVVTPTIKMPSKNFYSTIYRYGEMTYTDWRADMLTNFHMAEYRSAENMSMLGVRDRQVITYIQSAPVSIGSTPKAQIVILLDAEKLRSSLEQLGEATSAGVYLVDKNSNVILSSAGAGTLSPELLKAVSKSSVTSFYLSKDKKMVQFKNCAQGSFKVIMTMDRSVYYKSLYEMRGKFMWQIALMMAVGFLLALLFSTRNYAPIREIVDIIGGSSGNELDSIKKAIMKSFEEQKELSETLSAHMSEMQKSFFQRRLSGTEAMDISGGEGHEQRLGAEISSLGIKLVSQRFIVISVAMDMTSRFFEEEEKQPNINIATSRLIIENIGNELLTAFGMKSFFVSLEKNLSVFVVNLPEAEKEKEKIEQAFEQISTILEEHFSISFFSGCGRKHYGIRQLYESLDEARKAMDYGVLTGNHGLIHYDNVVDLDNDYFYPIELEIQLTNLLRVGDCEQASRAIESVFEVNFSRKSINSQAGRCLVVEVSGTLIKVMNSILAQSGQTLFSAEGIQEQLIEKTSFEEMKKELLKLVEQICAMSHTRQSNQTERLVNRIERFIMSSEEWLDLATIAAKFDITPQYLSTVFKKYKSENIKEYISKMRLEKAKTMLCETSLTVDEVAQKLGYANETGLNRLFKKYEGITPGAYRSSRRGTER